MANITNGPHSSTSSAPLGSPQIDPSSKKAPCLKPSRIAPTDAMPLSPKRVIELGRRPLKNKISRNCIAKLKEVLGKYSLNKTSLTLNAIYGETKTGREKKEIYSTRIINRAYLELKQKVSELQEEIVGFDLKDLNRASEKRLNLQNKINDLLNHSAYQALKEYEIDPLVHFLHTAADIIHNHSEGMSEFERLGEKLAPGLEANKSYNFHKFHKLLVEARDKSSDLSADTFRKRLPAKPGSGTTLGHFFRHPIRELMTFLSEHDVFDRFYDPYKTGNYNAMLGHYEFGATQIGSSAGPNPNHDEYRIFPAILQRNENLTGLGLDLKHTQVILEGAEKKSGAKERRGSVLEKAPLENTQYIPAALPLDGIACERKSAEFQVKTAEAYVQAIDENRMEAGVILRGQDFKEPDYAAVHNSFEKSFRNLEQTEAWGRLLKEGTLNRTLLLGYDAILAVSLMTKISETVRPPVEIDSQHKITSTFNMACKQGIDRGVIMNTMVRMLVDAKAKGKFELSRDQIQQYIGYSMGRATSVEAREIQDKRFEALSNFVLMIAQATPEQQKAFLNGLDFKENLRFVPSNFSDAQTAAGQAQIPEDDEKQ